MISNIEEDKAYFENDVNSCLDSKWSFVPLKDVVVVKGGKRLPKGTDYASETTVYPYIRVVDFVNGTISIDNLKFLTKETQEKIKRYTISKDDVYISIAGTIGLAGTVPEVLDGANLTENAAKLVINDPSKLDKDFLAMYLNGEQGKFQIETLTSKTTQPKLALARIEQIQIPLPPLPKQRAIAHVLQSVQDAIQARRKELELERERKAALMQHLFTHGTHGEPTKQTDIGEIPESWEVVLLGKKYKIQYGLGQPPQRDDDGIPMVRATDIKNGRIIKDTVIKIDRKAIPEKRAHFLQEGDIIVVRSGAYTGDVAMYGREWDVAIAGYDLVASPRDNDINSCYVAYYLLSDVNQSYFRSQRDRSAQPHLNADQLSNTRVPLSPNKDEQQEIATILQSCDSKIIALEKEIALHNELFRTLLDELMTGKLSALPLVE